MENLNDHDASSIDFHHHRDLSS